ncbi:MAG TPA: EAL domain-containing protein [Gallionellaceae bacterium]|nr:EAL domain-containing protein [Gallionellaceae bacterium]
MTPHGGKPARIPSPLRLLLAVLVTVFSIEILVMAALPLVPQMPPWGEDVLDASALAIILFPVVYFLVYRPLVETIRSLERANESRREHEARLHAMLDNLPSMAWLKNVEGRYLAVNQKFVAACGKTDASEVIGKTSAEVCPQWMMEGFRDDDQAIMASGRQTLTELHTPGGGEHQWLEVYRNPITDAQGKLLGIAGYVLDITARRKSEEQMRLTAKIFEKSHDSIIITETDGTIISVNPAFTRITGYTPEEVIGKNPRILNSGKQRTELYTDMWASLLRDGYWEGEVWNRRKNGAHYAGRLAISALRDESGRVTHYVGVTSDITEFKLAQDRVRHLAYYDQLTGLPNGGLMRDRVNQLIASSQRDRREFALLIIDIDNFKNINDSLGHHVGDLILQTLASRLKGVVREMDMVARMGGDEFVLVVPEVGAEGAKQVARKVIGHVTNTIGIGLHKISMTASVGIGVFPKDGSDVESIIKNAELALYQAKGKGKNDFAFFTEKLNVLALERLRLENDLRNALLNEELVLYYQPQISMKTRRVVGLEALVRWPHASLNMIPPDQFIPIAEDSDLIIQLGEWSIHEACRQMRQWQRAGLMALPVAVNVSARQMRHESFFDSVESALRKTGLDARYLELELTERAVMTDVDNAVEVMNRVGGMGVSFSVDDFGTGHSSLAYLKHLPIKKLKIDKTFVQDIAAEENDREISNTIIQLAHGLHLTVVAEGVETQQQMSILMGQGCDIAQGYLFSRPLPTLEIAAYLRAAQAA